MRWTNDDELMLELSYRIDDGVGLMLRLQADASPVRERINAMTWLRWWTNWDR